MEKNKKRKRGDDSIYCTPIKKLKKYDLTPIEIKTNRSSENKKNNKLFKSKKGNNQPQIIKKKSLKHLSYENFKLNLNTVEKLHNLALTKFNQLKNKNDLSYKTILDEILNKLYDLDETINEFFLEKLREYYEENKINIDKEKDGKSDEIASLFFKYIFTLKSEKRKKISKDYYFFKENELFLEDDKIYFYGGSLEDVFRKFVKELLKISSTVESESSKFSEEKYRDDLIELYSNYRFPNSSYKIPIKFGNKELMYLHFIIELQTILCVEDEGSYKKKFIQFDFSKRLLAFNFFKDYFESGVYDILSIQYIIFSIKTIFLFWECDIDLIEENIKNKMFACSRFLYQKIEEKKQYLKELKIYIQNMINIDEIDENYLNNNILIFKNNEKEIKINGNNCYFLGNKTSYINDLFNDNVYSFEYLRSLKFPLFMDKYLNDDFNTVVKEFLQSNLTNEYINSLQKIPKFNETVFTDEIIEEINNNTLWVKFPVKQVQGLSDINTYTIYLNNSFNDSDKNKFSCFLSSKIITKVHEDSNHILRLLLAINNYEISKISPKKCQNIYKYYSYNQLMTKYEDQGDLWEHILFGEKLSKFFIMGSLCILNINNFKLKIKEFKTLFQKRNRKYEIGEINIKIGTIKKNEKNKLIKYINKYGDNDLDKDLWLKNEQYISARNNSAINFNESQFINFGICGTHGFDKNLI